MMSNVAGGCRCGNVRIDVALTRATGAYEPRACDCDFCVQHGVAYVSDPQGAVSLRIEDGQRCLVYRQGSGNAAFVGCKACSTLVGVFYRTADGVYAAVNANVLKTEEPFGPEKSVSPKQLSAHEKTSRWQALWFPRVEIAIERGTLPEPVEWHAPTS